MSTGKFFKINENATLIAIIADEDTVTGFLLAGIGERNNKGEVNFLIVDAKTPKKLIEDTFRKFTSRGDIAMILITQTIAEKDLRHLINEHHDIIPSILEIPSKDTPYDPSKDPIVSAAKRYLLGSDNVGR
mmetsp:Transcript_59412/g.67598  ORF Transcript_59412/g.67598 Transcript_59412/m.67598 type:complete len:131 (-) Transcript_59412:169-561(-)|eukprot:CAMPEP_0115024850 /NCGR_PEP_ID=MMETSP0216-20121206/33557_1 /TAXON_ID=223996 /ORGANISM="Protocruzia adherens, Strain Boccale" /LENGTH=130 /DNA_ID=CAMNT_0002399135 /DNA_START=37 /DNA_END=429 /DNA_ORIENTATION=-